MSGPDDFGMTAPATLSRVASPARAGRHAAFMRTFLAAVWAGSPSLRERGVRDADPSDGSATHEFESVGTCRIGCRLVLPEDARTPIRAGVVTTHGYEGVPSLGASERAWRALAERGVAVLVVRVRGYPGSQADVPGMVRWLETDGGTRRARPGEAYAGGGLWIVHGIEEPLGEGGIGCSWSVAQGVADVVNACRALRRLVEARARGERPLLMLHGESFGGGLAVLAASCLAEGREPVDRLGIALPALGDWAWRLEEPGRRCAQGSGRRVAEFLSSRRDREESIRELLHVLDAATHARRVRAATLCKLAQRDEVVPAPAAAAVFNAIGASPAEKWRYVVSVGHEDGGIADARRHAMFERVLAEFLDPSRPVAEAMRECEGWMRSGPRPGMAWLSAMDEEGTR